MATTMKKKDQDAIDAAKRAYADAQARGDKAGMEAAHRQAESVRAGYGYSGGVDGSQYIPKSGGSSTGTGRGSGSYNSQSSSQGFNPSSVYTPIDNSGNDYAALVNMSAADRAGLEAAKKGFAEAQARGDREAMSEFNLNAENIRAKYGYSGGSDGSQYILLQQENGAPSGFGYQSAPTYQDKYTDRIDELLNDILNRDDFSYNALEDPLYQQYRDQYRREGDRAMQDALGQLSARTGGLASSWAGTAAQQQGDYYASMAADKIPELYQLAYSMYMDDLDSQVRDLGLLEQMSSSQYDRYRDTVDDWRNDRSFAYNKYRDDVGDARYGDETAYNRDLYTSETEYNRALDKAKTLAALGDFSGYQALGYSPEEIARMQGAYALSQTPVYGGSSYRGGGSGSSGGASDSSIDGGMDYDGLFQAAMDSGNAESFIKQKSNYKAYGLDSAPSYNDYKNWLTRQQNLASRQSSQNGYVPVADLNAGSNQSGAYAANADKGSGFNEVWRIVKNEYDNGASTSSIVNYLTRQAQLGKLTEAGQNFIIQQLRLA